MALKDFSITLQKVKTSTSTKDVGMVSGFNAISQYIENVTKTNKGEVPSDVNFGSDYFNYIFDGNADVGVMELKLAADIASKIPELIDVKVNVIDFTQNIVTFEVFYSLNNGVNKQQNSSCFIEVQV
jgi:hypothetical protein